MKKKQTNQKQQTKLQQVKEPHWYVKGLVGLTFVYH